MWYMTVQDKIYSKPANVVDVDEVATGVSNQRPTPMIRNGAITNRQHGGVMEIILDQKH